MKEELQQAPERLDLGQWLGRREAYGMMAGKSAAAEVTCLREIRDKKKYTSEARTWDEFCTKVLASSRRTVDEQISYLDEFGPKFFEVSQLMRINAERYRELQEHITHDGLRLDGQVIALLPENTGRLRQAVKELGKRAKPQTPPFDLTLERCETAARQLDKLPYGLDIEQKLALAEVLGRMRKTAAGLGVMLTEVSLT